MQSDTNSLFSNDCPEDKKRDNKSKIANGSLKLRLMAENTKNSDDWMNKACKIHENEMINILKEENTFRTYRLLATACCL